MTRNTLDLFDKLAEQGCHAETIDDVAWLVHQGKLRAKQARLQYGDDYRLVDEAKAVVSAMFLRKESEAMTKRLTAYRNFLRRIFNGTTDFSQALTESPWRVLSFNYDRLFELAFLQHFDVDMSQTFYGPTRLNSGLFLVRPEMIKVETNRFSLLKLHGSVGFFGIEDRGACKHRHLIPELLKPVSIVDDEFIFDAQQGIHSNRAKPSLIVFPHEKGHLKEYPTNTLPFRFYIPEIWRAARDFLAKADEVCIIGYSIPEADWSHLESLLKSMPETCRFVVQNPPAEAIAAKLRVRLPASAARIATSPTDFDG